jgi:dTDP-4-dehydrorhamnose reductase
MKIIIVGKGYIGTFIGKALGIEPVALSDAPDLSQATVINAVGFCGSPNIDECEDHPQRTHVANVEVPLQLAPACKHLIHLSSGCLFDGDGPFSEEDEPNLVRSVYTRTKREAELRLLYFSNVAILRIRMPLDATPHPRNLITKVSAYSRVIDRQNSVTWLPDLAEALKGLLLYRGIVHVVNRDTVSPHELNPSAERLTSLEGLTRVPRSNCRLSVDRLEKHLGRPMPSIRRKLTEAGILLKTIPTEP